VTVRFHPDRVGARAARLEFTDDAPGSPHSVALSGTGVSPVALTPSSIAFPPSPDHYDGAIRTVTLTNVAPADLTIHAVALRGADAGSFIVRGDTCTGQTLAGGQTCTVQVRFRPLGAGAKTAALRFSDSAIDSPHTVQLAGTGTPGPWLERSVQALKFGHSRVGATTAAKRLTLTNVGSAPLTIFGIAKGGLNPADFRNLTQTCTAMGTLNPGESCTASIAFRPTATGPRAATLTITDTAPRNPHHIALNGTGT
jgi:Abnormal spindle-like microcephaly-assoc'd, ASPM-SPD-2-Hydin